MKSIILTTLLTSALAVTAFVPESDDFNANTTTAATSILSSASGAVFITQAPGPERRRVRRRTRRRVNRRHERRENHFFGAFSAVWA